MNTCQRLKGRYEQMKGDLGSVKKYAVFSGRASRKEYWLFLLSALLVNFALILIVGSLSPGLGRDLAAFHWLTLIDPHIPVLVRRLHGPDHSWAMMLAFIILLVGIIAFLIMMTTPGARDENRYDATPE